MRSKRGMLFLCGIALLFSGSAISVHAENGWEDAYKGCVERHDPGCIVVPTSASVAVETPKMLKRVRDVNFQVDRSMKIASDISQYYTNDYWISGQPKGDCEDFALTKRARLIAQGVPANALRLAIVHIRGAGEKEVHAILLAYLSKHPDDPYVLDSLTVLFVRLSMVKASNTFDQFYGLQNEHGNWGPWNRMSRPDVLTAGSRDR